MLNNTAGIITGGGSGIGRAAVLACARAGARVLVADVQDQAGAATVAQVKALGGEAAFVHCDVSQAEQVQALVAAAVETYGRLDWAFNNAGIEGAINLTADVTEANFDRVIATNLKGIWLCMKYELQQMLTQGKGAIVNTTSIGGLKGAPGFPAYAASKGGVIQLTRTAALEYAKTGIRVNAVCPGVIDTPLFDRTLANISITSRAAGPQPPRFITGIVDRLLRLKPVQAMAKQQVNPVGRLGQPEEIADAVVYMCSDAASFMTGHVMVLDGGAMLG